MSLRYANILLGVLLWIFSVWVISQSLDFRDPRTGQMPIVLAGFFILAGTILIILNAIPKTGRPMEGSYPYANIPWLRWFVVATLLVGFGAGAVTIGFYESAFLFLLLVSSVMSFGRGNPLRTFAACLVFALIGVGVLYLGFSIVLGIPIPDGILI